jgi:hypothetical protein
MGFQRLAQSCHQTLDFAGPPEVPRRPGVAAGKTARIWGIISEGGWPEGARSMGSAAVGIALLVLVVGCILGWHANRTYAAHGDIKTTHNRIAGYRKTRLRSGLMALGLVIAALFILAAVIRH